MREIAVTNSMIYEEAIYMINHKATVRQASAHFGRSKSAIHMDMRERLPHINRTLATEIAALLNFNLEDRSRRGGMASKRKANKNKGDLI